MRLLATASADRRTGEKPEWMLVQPRRSRRPAYRAGHSLDGSGREVAAAHAS